MKRRLLGVSLGTLGFGLFGLVIYLAGPVDVALNIWALGWDGIVLVVLDVVAALLFWALSWKTLLSSLGIKVGCGRLLGSLASGFAVSYLTPSAYLGGEPVRVMLVGGNGNAVTEITATVVVERILAAISTVLFAAMGGFFVVISPKISLFTKRVLLFSLGGLVLFSFFLLWAFVRNYRPLTRIFEGLAALFPKTKFFARAACKIREVEETTHHVFSRRPIYALLAFIFQSLTVFCNYIRPQIFFGFGQGTWLSFPQLSLYFSLNVMISTFFWVTPAGLGIAEGGRMAILRIVGIPPHGAVAFALTFRFLELIFVGVGVGYLIHRGVGFLGRKALKSGFRPPDARER
ncbi:TPA: flippase-like domain-containing protein [Candidatus Micrarchaeota archaeon]|nr:flippase-like domain-containing protein [Candidatus Micrarchaeota archaeon]